MAKAVEIIISATDKASDKFKSVQNSMLSTSKAFKETSNQAKASTELVGTFATVLGNSGIGGIAGEIAQLTERFSAFSEVAEQSKLAGLAFRGALVAGVAVAAVKIGQAIGDVIFQTDRLNAAMERSAELARNLDNQLVSRRSTRIGEQIAELEQINDLEQRRATAQQLQAQIGGDIEAKAAEIRNLTAEIEEREAGVAGWVKSWYGEYQKTTEIKQHELELATQMRDSMQSQNQQLLEIIAGERERERLKQQQAAAEQRQAEQSQSYLDTLNQQLEVLQAQQDARQQVMNRNAGSRDFARIDAEIERAEALAAAKLEAARITTEGDRGEAMRLIAERDAIQAKAAAEKAAREERKKAAEEERRDMERIAAERERDVERVASARENAIEAIQRQVIALRDGEQAARAFTLQQQGLDTGTAKMIAAAEEKLKALQDAGKKRSSGRQSEESFIAAAESRLLNRGTGTNPMLQATQSAAKETEMSRKVLMQIQQILAAIQRKEPVQLVENSA